MASYPNILSVATEASQLFIKHRHSVAYFDIETTGLGNASDIITTVALYDGRTIRHYVNGQNLNDFTRDIRDYDAIITFNGKAFDVPFIERYLSTRLAHVHLDLRFILKDLGYSGGLKSCEQQLGIGRSGQLADVDGYFAIRLWQDYITRNNERALETLLAYNIADVVNLEYLMITSYNLTIERTKQSGMRLSIPIPPTNPFKIDESTIMRLKGHTNLAFDF